MKRKNSFFDFIAALAFVFDVEWDEEYPPDDAADFFWDNPPGVAEPVCRTCVFQKKSPAEY